MFVQGCARLSSGNPKAAHVERLSLKSTEEIEQGAMPRRVEKAALIMLAVNFDKLVSDLTKQTDADGLVVHESARTTVFRLQAAKD
jgi:hypothetical protein